MTEKEYKHFENHWDALTIGSKVNVNIANLYQFFISKIDNKEHIESVSVFYLPRLGKYEGEYSFIKVSPSIDDDTLYGYYDYYLYDKETGKHCALTSILYPTVECKILDIEKSNNIIYVQFKDNEDDEPVDTAFTKDEFFAVASEYIHGGKDVIPTF